MVPIAGSCWLSAVLYVENDMYLVQSIARALRGTPAKSMYDNSLQST